MQATTTIPIVGIDLETDPVAAGFVKTLARPGGNVSGIWMDLPEIAGKQIQFLREVLPALRRLGIVWDDRIGQLHLAAVQAAPAPWASVCTLPRYTRRRMSMRR
jgi:putative ABC transport system substrate-binding protein